MSSSNCCFVTCIQVSQETGKVVWYSHLLKNFPQFVVIHTVKGFSTVNEAEVGAFLEFSSFFYDPMDVGNLISGSSVFAKFSLYIWNFSVHVLLKFSLKDFEHYLASRWNDRNCSVVWALFVIAHFWTGMKTDIFHACGHCWPLQICWCIEHNTVTASSFRIWSSSARIPSPLLASFIVMLPKTH